MKTGPRLFAIAVLAAATALPKTGWVVKNEADLLLGRWSVPRETPGYQSVGIVPKWAFDPDAVQEPAAKAISEPLVNGESGQERWARIRPLIRDPKVRDADRAAVLRRAFTTVLPSHKEPAELERMRGFVKELRPLAVEGERADPFNAFYPTCRAVFEEIDGNMKARDEAIRRASECTFYEDDAWGEAERYCQAFEVEHGYRGSVLRITRAGTVLLPQYAQFNNIVKEIVTKAPLDDPQRRQFLAMGRTLETSGNNKVSIYVGRSLILRAVGTEESVKDNVDVDHWFAPFERANPGFETKEYKRLAKAAQPEGLLDFGEFETGFSSLATAVGGGLLVAALMALGIAWPVRKGFDDELPARMVRANWAWLGFVPAAFYDGGENAMVLLGMYSTVAAAILLLCRPTWGKWPAIALALISTVAGLSLVQVGAAMWGIPGLLWLGAALIPERARVGFAAAFLTLVAGCTAWKVASSHGYAGAYLFIGTILLVVAARKAMPSRTGLTLLPAIAASLWLVGLGVELVADAQTGAALDRLRHEADTFRRERSI